MNASEPSPAAHLCNLYMEMKSSIRACYVIYCQTSQLLIFVAIFNCRLLLLFLNTKYPPQFTDLYKTTTTRISSRLGI